MSITYTWRDEFANGEVNDLHAEAFTAHERDWRTALTKWSLGWVTARDSGHLVGFVNVVWDGLVHAWIQDTMVAEARRGQGIGSHLVNLVGEQAKDAGCQWLHVDFDESLGIFYYEACGFSTTSAGLILLA
jgi:GNAT superfamily N-acetyltransferase